MNSETKSLYALLSPLENKDGTWLYWGEGWIMIAIWFKQTFRSPKKDCLCRTLSEFSLIPCNGIDKMSLYQLKEKQSAY